MTRRNLILIHRGREYERDFVEIAEKVHGLDPDITIYTLGSAVRQGLPEAAWRHPTLVVAVHPAFKLDVKRGHVIKSHVIPKLEQAERARAAGVNVPPIAKFTFGMKLDPILFGNLVVLKPMTLTSHGDGVHLFRRARAEQLKPSDFPAHHPVHRDPAGYLVQRFIDTGDHPTWNRVISYMAEPIYAVFGSHLAERPPLDAADHVLANARIAIQGSERQRIWRVEDDVTDAARKIGAAFHDAPLLAIDFLRDAKTDKLWFLECNPGGNTWHFSSDQAGGVNLRMELGEAWLNGEAKANELGRQRMIDQFGAWDICARALVKAAHELAC